MLELLWLVIMVLVWSAVAVMIRNALRDGTLHQPGLKTVLVGMVLVSLAMPLEVVEEFWPGFGQPFIDILRLAVFYLGGAVFVLRGFYLWLPLGTEVRRQYAATQAELVERKKAEAALLEAQELLEQRVLDRTSALQNANRRLYRQALTFATLAEGVVVTDLEGTILDANAAAAIIFGYSLERIVGRPIKPDLFLAVPFRSWQKLQRLIERDGQWTSELQYQHPSGHKLIIDCRIVIYYNERDEPAGFIAVGRDVTAQRQAETIVRRHTLAFENLAESIIIADNQGMILDCNPATTTIFGDPREEVVGKSVFLWKQHPVGTQAIEVIVGAVEGGGRWMGSAPFVRPDGTDGTLALTVLRLYDEKQQTMGAVVLSRDVTEQVRAEAARQRDQALLQGVLRSTPARLAVLAHDGSIILSNDSWQEFAEEGSKNGIAALLSTDVRRAIPALPPESDDARAIAQGINDVLEGAQASFSFEYAYDKNHITQWFLLQVSPLLAERGGVVVIHTDITARKVVQHNLMRQERFATLGRLSTTLAHEINNPLQAIRGNLDLVLDFNLPPGEQRDLLETIRNEIMRLSSGTVRILNFARPRPRLAEPVFLDAILEQTFHLVEKDMENHNITLISLLQPTPKVSIDPDGLSQVCLNILLNSKESLTTGGTITVRTGVHDGRVLMTIENDGPPIPADTLPHLFEPFFTTKGEGTGLGLYICHGIVEQYGGTIRGENLPGQQGVRFTVSLPPMVPVHQLPDTVAVVSRRASGPH